MSCHTCNRSFEEGCLVADFHTVPYVAFVIGAGRLYAGKIVAQGNAGYRILTPGGTQHLVKFNRIRCAEPRIFNCALRSQCAKKRMAVPEINLETYFTVYYDGQVFGDV